MNWYYRLDRLLLRTFNAENLYKETVWLAISLPKHFECPLVQIDFVACRLSHKVCSLFLQVSIE